MKDYAIVAGVARYPELSADGVAADLDGPDNDAQAIYDWLVDPQGGELDPANVRLIRSAGFDPVDPQPAVASIERELRWVEKETRDTSGCRLYLYFSGHGFSPVLEEGALFTAEATQVSPTYVYAHAWLRWFRRAQRFQEFVLWMDCCMNWQQSIPVNEVVMRPKIGTGVPGPAFVALAAQTKSALEYTAPDGQAHGVFTWTLLKGLAGGACDERGRVTGESLKRFLYNAMPEFLPEDAKKSASVDLQPFVRTDDGIVFRRLAERPKHRVHLDVPPTAAGQNLKIWAGQPHRQVVSEVLAGNQWTGALVRGLYLAEVPTAGIRHGFQVSGAGDVDVALTRQGPEVVPSDGSELVRLDIVAENPAAAIALVDHHFDRIFVETGELHERDVPGVYKVRMEFGRDITMVSEEVLLLDRDFVVGHVATPQLPSPAAIPSLAFVQRGAVESFDVVAAPAPGGAGVSIIARYETDPTTRGALLAFPHPMEGLRLVGSDGQQIADLTEHSTVDDRAGTAPVASFQREVPPGTYFLRQTLRNGRAFEGAIVVPPNWTTQVEVRRAVTGGATDRDTARAAMTSEVTVSMRAAGALPRPPEQDAVTEAARLALAQGRNLFKEGRGSQLQDLLLRTYEDPIACIIGSHLLLLADPAGGELFDSAVDTLRGLVGPEHPDVAALSLRCADVALRARKPFTVPPMLRHSWHLIIDASYGQPDLVPAQLWQRVHASAQAPLFFLWATDETARAGHLEQLSQWAAERAQAWETSHLGGTWTGGSAEPLPDALRDAVRRLQVPAVAATALWDGLPSPRHA